MLNNDEIDIYIVGDIDEEDMIEKITVTFTFNARQTSISVISH